MPLDASQTLRNLKAAKDPIGFAFGAGTKATVLLAEKGKAGVQLAPQVKKESGASQICIGSAVWGSSGAILYCDRPLSGMQKSVEGWAKANGLSLKCTIEAGEPPARNGKGKDKNGKDEDDDDQDPIFEPPTLLKRLKQAKTKPVFFGFGIGAKGPNLLTLHPTREGKKLFQLIRQHNGATKGAFGTVTVDGQIAAFECEKKVPGLKAMLKALFKEAKLPFKPLIEDSEDEEDEDEFDEKIKPAIAKLEAEKKKLMPALKMVIRLQQDNHDKEVEAALKTMDAALQKRDLATAKKTLEELRKLAVHAGDTVMADEDEETERKAPGKGDLDFKKAARTWQQSCEELANDLKKLEQKVAKVVADGTMSRKLGGEAKGAIDKVRGLYDYKGMRNALLSADKATKDKDEGRRAKAVAICLARIRKHKADTKRKGPIDTLEELPEAWKTEWDEAKKAKGKSGGETTDGTKDTLDVSDVKITIRKTMMSGLTTMEDQLG